MEFGEAFKILEIDPTDDKKKIKVAYSKMLKKYHPEDFPEMFMRINEAYEKALEYGGEDFQEEFFGNEEEFEEYEGFSNEYNIEITNDEDEEFSNIFSGELEKVEKNVDNWIEAFGKLLNGEKMFFGSLRFLMEEFDSFGKKEKRRIKEILNLENDNYENNVILQSKNITKFEKDYIFLHLIKDKTKFQKIEELYRSNEKSERNKAVEIFVENYFNVKKWGIFGFFIFWNIYPKGYKNGKLHHLLFFLKNNVPFKRIAYHYEKIKEMLHRMEIFQDDEIQNQETGLFGIVFILSSLMVVFIWIFSLPVITDMMPAEYEDVLTTFGIVKTFSIMLAVARSYYDIMLAKRGNSINIASMLYIQILLLGIYLFKIYLKYEIIDFTLNGTLVFLFAKLLIVNRIKYNRIRNYAKDILDSVSFDIL